MGDRLARLCWATCVVPRTFPIRPLCVSNTLDARSPLVSLHLLRPRPGPRSAFAPARATQPGRPNPAGSIPRPTRIRFGRQADKGAGLCCAHIAFEGARQRFPLASPLPACVAYRWTQLPDSAVGADSAVLPRPRPTNCGRQVMTLIGCMRCCWCIAAQLMENAAPRLACCRLSHQQLTPGDCRPCHQGAGAGLGRLRSLGSLAGMSRRGVCQISFANGGRNACELPQRLTSGAGRKVAEEWQIRSRLMREGWLQQRICAVRAPSSRSADYHPWRVEAERCWVNWIQDETRYCLSSLHAPPLTFLKPPHCAEHPRVQFNPDLAR